MAEIHKVSKCVCVRLYVCLHVCLCVCVRQSQSECLCIWASGGGRAIICSKLLAGRGEVGETVIQKESKGRREKERERGKGGGQVCVCVCGGVLCEDKQGRNELAREKKCRKKGENKERGDGEIEVSSSMDSYGLRMLYSYCTHCPRSSPTHCHAGLRGRRRGS